MLSRLRSSLSSSTSSVPLDEPTALSTLRSSLEKVPAAQTPEAQEWLTDECLLRYLRARSLSPSKAQTMITATLTWRASYGTGQLWEKHEQSLRNEASSAKMFVLPNVDRMGRSVIVMRPGLENSSDGAANVRYLVYTLERAAEITKEGKFTVLVDYFTGKINKSTLPGMSVMKETTAILHGHYPERLGCAFLYNAPKFFYGLFKMLSPFIDPATKQKIFFVNRETAKDDENCKRLLDLEHTPKEYGGQADLHFDVDKYFDDYHSNKVTT